MLQRAFYLGAILLGMLLTVAALVFLGFVYAEGRGADREVIPFLIVPAFVPMGCGYLLHLILLYQMWAAIPRESARTTPLAAAGLMLIPLWNLYWVFQAYWGWTKDYNRFVADRRIEAPRASEAAALAYAITAAGAVVPVLGFCLGPIALLLLLFVLHQGISGISAIRTAQR
ncbi:MAG: hypothetical protein U0166_00475 [Acidobacteriota bacterium]